ncbi:MAG: lactate racemase domain-containing protein, partial [Armatimonadota bacterium]
MDPVFPSIGAPGHWLSDEAIAACVEATLGARDLGGSNVLAIIPDSTRTAPLRAVFQSLHEHLKRRNSRCDVMVALGTHAPMAEDAIRQRLGITLEERNSVYSDVAFLNHAWNDPSALRHLGTLSSAEIASLSGGRFAMDVPVTANAKLLDYDHIVIIGPVFPHEVVGFSGGNKYLFPGVSGPEVLNFFHWLGAVITSPAIIGVARTPVREVIDRAARMVPTPKSALCLVVADGGIVGIFGGDVEPAWQSATEHSAKHHIRTFDRPFSTVLACAPTMYDELWVGAKCMYKLEPVVADGGELIIHAPHIDRISIAHGAQIERIGYHCRDYFLGQWEKFREIPWGVLAHSTHVRGVGTFRDGIEHCRIRVTLSTGIPEETCKRIGLGYRNPESIDPESFAGRE